MELECILISRMANWNFITLLLPVAISVICFAIVTILTLPSTFFLVVGSLIYIPLFFSVFYLMKNGEKRMRRLVCNKFF